MNWTAGLDVVRLGVIAGPTGSGKSAVALDLARLAPVTIISADSRQVYRGFDIGTAKPTGEERARVPHALVDMADPGERVGAARWAEAASLAIDEARAMGRIPLVVGGTGLYVRALFEPLFAEPPLDPVARGVVERELAERTTEELRQEVAVIDPVRAHLGRTQLLRAIEIARLTGESMSSWHARAGRNARFAPHYLVLDRGPALGPRLEARVDAMLRAGWLGEVEGLEARVPDDAPAWNATGYDAIRAVVRGTLDLVTARQQVIISTRQYAKRQRTWFRHQLDEERVTRVDLEQAGSNDRVLQWWHAQETK